MVVEFAVVMEQLVMIVVILGNHVELHHLVGLQKTVVLVKMNKAQQIKVVVVV
jgi:hypothetical protein